MRFTLSITFCLFIIASTTKAQEEVRVVASKALEGPAAHGVEELAETMAGHGIDVSIAANVDSADGSHVIVAGLASEPSIAALVESCGLDLPEHPEALAVGRVKDGESETVVLCGGGPSGLMYAALDVADRISWAADDEDLFAHVRNVSESPSLSDRSISAYTMHRRLFEQRLHDEAYWERYFDLLAKSRVNSYVIIFGYENGGFMAPLYPFFFDVEEFPDVKLYGITEEEQAKNTASLRRVIELAHERGIRFTVGIWDHIYRGGVQGGGIEGASELAGKNSPHLAYGVTTENLAPYTKAALRQLMTTFPDIDGIQFRMHWESGLTREETPGFWRDVFTMLKELQPDMQIDLRAKGLPDEVIDDAFAKGLPFRIATKYWMEQLGMPFHPTHVNPRNQHDRRHGYADLLRHPKRYEMHWRMWNGGTSRFLLWGDPEYVRRFVESAKVYGGDSFEVNEMLATKMLGEPHNAEPFELLTPPYRHYTYEFERYWHYYQVWGRLSYNPDAPADIWQRDFQQRFGPEAGPFIMRSLHRASNILPRIVAASYNYRYFPTTRGWAEIMRMGDLPEYAKGTGTDVEQFQSYEDAAERLLEGGVTAKRTPFETARWFDDTAEQVLRDVAAAESALGSSNSPEFLATAADLRILARLAQYHAARMKAAVWYNVYLRTEDRVALEHCVARESQAINAWKRIIVSASDIYPETLAFGVHRVGFSRHWKEELPKLEQGLDQLRALPSRDALAVDVRNRILSCERNSVRSRASVELSRPDAATPGQDLKIQAIVKSRSPVASIRLRYRHLTQFEDYEAAPMAFDVAAGAYTAAIPGEFIVPEWDLIYFVDIIFKDGRGCCAPDLEGGMPYVIVPTRRIDNHKNDKAL